MREEREEVIQFSHVTNTPVVDSVSPLMDLLNDNSYEKGAWVLHMLRNEVGDSVFQRIIRTYYDQYKGRNADTRDFQAVAEKVSGQTLKPFFDQWLYQPGLPKIKGEWKFDGNKVNLIIQQTGKNLFQFPLEVGLIDAAGKQIIHKISVTSTKASFPLPVHDKPVKVVLDPNTVLLFEGNITEKR